eukprot:SAG11_NODE_116_length_16002_cov_19.164560_3_plen_37_part_00
MHRLSRLMESIVQNWNSVPRSLSAKLSNAAGTTEQA